MFSDNRPPYILPDTPIGHEYYDRECRGVVETVFCDRFCKSPNHVFAPGDEHHPIVLPFCGNRDRSGERSHNWCYACMSGFFFTPLTERDSEAGRDNHRIDC